MIVLLEGADGVGKTTLCDAIEAAHVGPVYRIRSGPPGEDEMPALKYLDDVSRFASIDGLVIVDRLHVGELVYGPIMRGESGLSIDEACLVDMALEGLGAVLVHCCLPRDGHRARLTARDGGKPDEKSGASLDHMDAIRVGFRQMVAALPGRWLNLDMDGYPDQLACDVLARRPIDKFGPARGWLGRWRANNLFVAPRDSDVHHLSFIVRQLRTLGVLKDSVLIPAGYDLDLGWGMVGRNVFALGRHASEFLQSKGLDMIELKHRDDEHHYGDGRAPWLDEVKRVLERGSQAAEAI